MADMDLESHPILMEDILSCYFNQQPNLIFSEQNFTFVWYHVYKVWRWFLETSDHELDFIEKHHPELRGAYGINAEIYRINNHILVLSEAMVAIEGLRYIGEWSLEVAYERDQLMTGNFVDCATIIVPFKEEVEVDTVCAICQGVPGVTCDSPSIICHPGCVCRGLPIYGKACIEMAFNYSTRCPNCRGELEDEISTARAKEALEVGYDSLTIRLQQELDIHLYNLQNKMNDLNLRHDLLEIRKKEYQKLEEAESTENNPAEVLTEDQKHRSVNVFSEDYITLVRGVMIDCLVPDSRWDIKNTTHMKVHLLNFIQNCESAQEAISLSLHRTIARKNIVDLSLSARMFLAALEDADGPIELGPFIGVNAIYNIFEYPFRPGVFAEQRDELINKIALELLPRCQSLTWAHIRTFRYFQREIEDQEYHVRQYGPLRQRYLQTTIHAIREILENERKSGLNTTCDYSLLESLADNCVQSIILEEMYGQMVFTEEGQVTINLDPKPDDSFDAEKLHAEWEEVYLMFRLDQLVARYREEKPDGWVKEVALEGHQMEVQVRELTEAGFPMGFSYDDFHR